MYCFAPEVSKQRGILHAALRRPELQAGKCIALISELAEVRMNMRVIPAIRLTRAIRLIPAVVCIGAALTACNLAEGDWQQATAANTLTAYQAFLQKHPDSKHADNARGRILALQDEQAWNTARAANSIAGYQDYLKTESGGVHVGEAKYQITALQRADAWKAIQNDASAASLQSFLLKYPQGLESNEARARLKAAN